MRDGARRRLKAEAKGDGGEGRSGHDSVRPLEFHRHEANDGHTQDDDAPEAEQDEAERRSRLPGRLVGEAEPHHRQGRVVLHGRPARPQAEVGGCR